jgi:hypothetical protein
MSKFVCSVEKLIMRKANLILSISIIQLNVINEQCAV